MLKCVFCNDYFVCFLFYSKGPIKVYNSENDLSMPFNCVLRKLPNQQTFGITVKGDCPVRVNHVDANSYAQVSKFPFSNEMNIFCKISLISVKRASE